MGARKAYGGFCLCYLSGSVALFLSTFYFFLCYLFLLLLVSLAPLLLLIPLLSRSSHSSISPSLPPVSICVIHPTAIPLPRYYLYVVALPRSFSPSLLSIRSFCAPSSLPLLASAILQSHFLLSLALFHSEKYLTALDIRLLADLSLKKRFNLNFSFLTSQQQHPHSHTYTHPPYHIYSSYMDWLVLAGAAAEVCDVISPIHPIILVTSLSMSEARARDHQRLVHHYPRAIKRHVW